MVVRGTHGCLDSSRVAVRIANEHSCVSYCSERRGEVPGVTHPYLRCDGSYSGGVRSIKHGQLRCNSIRHVVYGPLNARVAP